MFCCCKLFQGLNQDTFYCFVVRENFWRKFRWDLKKFQIRFDPIFKHTLKPCLYSIMLYRCNWNFVFSNAYANALLSRHINFKCLKINKFEDHRSNNSRFIDINISSILKPSYLINNAKIKTCCLWPENLLSLSSSWRHYRKIVFTIFGREFKTFLSFFPFCPWSGLQCFKSSILSWIGRVN